MPDWSPGQYLKFEDERTRPAAELLSRVPVTRPRRVLDVGCGDGQVSRLAVKLGAEVVIGLDPTWNQVKVAHERGGGAMFLKAGAGKLPFADASFDVVYGHGVLQYAAAPERIIAEAHRVLKPGGRGIFMVYNRISWLNALSKVMKVALEHEDAPVLKKYSIGEFRALLAPFAETRIVPERFPVKSRLHHGWKGMAFNGLFVGTFNALPRALVRPLGWHLMAFCTKAPVPAVRR